MHPLFLSVFASFGLTVAFSAGSAVEWCYHLPVCNDTTWLKIAPNFCSGSRQSPIDFASSSYAVEAPILGDFTFAGFSDKTAMSKIVNTGKTVKVVFKAGKLRVGGGGLSGVYDSLQFHLHWGNLSSSPGSEHTVDGKRYPMELHIVNAKSIYNGDMTRVLQDTEGLAALGFFIEVESGTTDQPASWKSLTSKLAAITEKDQYAKITGLSMNDLISGVDTTSYYRYLGSLSTPNCNEVVVWTVFKNPIKISRNLIDLFSTTVRVGNSRSPFMTNVYRRVQPLNGRKY